MVPARSSGALVCLRRVPEGLSVVQGHFRCVPEEFKEFQGRPRKCIEFQGYSKAFRGLQGHSNEF